MSPTTPPKIKVGAVGCGAVTTAYYLPYLRQMANVELTAVCDLVAARTATSMRLFGARSAYQDYDAMIEQTDLDAVFILTAPGTHVPFARKAVAAGKHILLQKPMATTMDEARTIANAVRQAGVKAIIEPSSQSPLDPDIAHLIDCILEDREPLVNVEWGLHITEMMVGTLKSSQTGRKYEMTTTLDY